MRILLLEDDANTAAYVSKGLEEEGHTVDHLADGRDAEMVRLGRVVLLYRVMEDGETGYWDNERKQFVPDPDSAAAIEEALSIAKEERAPDLIIVPVPAPQGARS